MNTQPIWISDFAAIEIILETIDQTEDLELRTSLLKTAGKLYLDAMQDLKNMFSKLEESK